MCYDAHIMDTTDRLDAREAARLDQVRQVIELQRNYGLTLKEACAQVSATTGVPLKPAVFRYWERSLPMVAELNSEVKQVMAETMVRMLRVLPRALDRLGDIIEDETSRATDVIAAVKEVRAAVTEFRELTDGMLENQGSEDEVDNFNPGFGPVIDAKR